MASHGPFVWGDDAFNAVHNAVVLEEVAFMASQSNLLRKMETPFMDTVKKAMEQVRINSPYLYVYPDIGNLTNAGKLYHASVDEDLKTGKGHLIACLKQVK